MIVPSSSSLLDNTPNSSSYTDNDDENPPPPVTLPYPTPLTNPQLTQWVHSIQEAIGDPIDERQTRSQFQRASSLLAEVSENYNLDTFVEASCHLEWDAAM